MNPSVRLKSSLIVIVPFWFVGLVAEARAQDCNNNGIPDDQDIANCDGSSWCGDCNHNGIPDGCDVASPPVRLFENRRDVPVHDGPTALAVDDLDADGYLDLVVGEDQGGHVRVYYGQADGSFGRTETYEISTRPSTSTSGFVIADFNGDGRLDFVVAELRYGSIVRILYGQAGGGFLVGDAITVGPGEPNPAFFAYADFDGDHINDLAVTLVHGNSVRILKGAVDGTFTPIDPPVQVGSFPYGIASSDFNRDGHEDLTVVNTYVSSVSVLFGLGDGSFGTRQDYVLGAAYANRGPGVPVAEDFNGDGWIDLAVSFPAEDKVVVLDGQPGGLFDPVNHRRDVPVGDSPWGLVAGDWNRDGFTDLAAANAVSGSVTALYGNGQGLFNIRQDFPVGAWPLNMAASDFDRDGWNDLAVTCHNANVVTILYNRTGWGGSADCNGNGVPDECDATPLNDSDGDLVLDICDNCPSCVNPAQEDTDGDGIGDRCDCGNVPCAPGVCIPTLSEWGMMAMAALMLSAGGVVIARRRAA